MPARSKNKIPPRLKTITLRWDLNCDLGELEPAARTRALMRWITAANVACGGHAGDADSMRRCVRLAKKHGVRLGAHPGPWDRANMGRGAVQITPEELELLLLQQVSALETVAREESCRLHHIKLHGGLYHVVEGSGRLAQAYLQCVKTHWPALKVYARSGGAVAREAKRSFSKITVWEEAFVDRGYTPEGGLVPRGEPGALLEDRADLIARVQSLCCEGHIQTSEGTRIPVRAQTLCIHGDSPHALQFARWTRQKLATLE